MSGVTFDGYMATEGGREAVMAKDLPLLFLSFPSAKDPNWKSHPGREGKSTAALITMSNMEWYKGPFTYDVFQYLIHATSLIKFS